MNITTTLSRYDQKDGSLSDATEDLLTNQITQVVSCIVRPQYQAVLQSRKVREKLIRDHIEKAG